MVTRNNSSTIVEQNIVEKRTNWCIPQFRLNPEVYVANAIGNNVEYKAIDFLLLYKTIYMLRLP